MQAAINVLQGPLAGLKMQVQSGEDILVGRLPDCDLAIMEDQTVSRRHCRLTVDASQLILTNLSPNGTLLNGTWVNEANLKDGDEIKLGQNNVLRISLVSEEPAAAEPDNKARTPSLQFQKTVESPLDSSLKVTLELDTPFIEPPAEFESPEAPCSVSVIHGPAAGSIVAIEPGKPLLIGRTSECGLPVERDPAISRRHCQIDFIPPDCFLTNLSSNGTRLNGEHVLEGKLKDNDEIEIGSNTVIRFHIDPALISGSGGAGASVPDDVIEVSRQSCPSGVEKVLCATAPSSAALLALRLSRGYNVLAVVDIPKSGATLPDGVAEPAYLHNWMPEETARAASPVVLSAADPKTFSAVLDESWGGDASIVVFSKEEPETVQQSLCSLAAFNPATGRQSPGNTLFAFWWPSLLRSLLAHSDKPLTDKILTNIDAVLCEDLDADGWQTFAKPEFVKHMENLGIVTFIDAAQH